MKRLPGWFLVTLGVSLWIFGFLMSVGLNAQAQRPARVQWEYKAVSSTFGKPAPVNEIGAEGWELVTVVTNGAEGYWIFKRQK